MRRDMYGFVLVAGMTRGCTIKSHPSLRRHGPGQMPILTKRTSKWIPDSVGR